MEGRKPFYDQLIRNLAATGSLSLENRLLLINDYYEGRYQQLLAQGKPPFVAESIVTIEMSQDPNVPSQLKNLVKPQLTASGVNGTYFIKNRKGEKIAVFKAMDEEAQMPNNPRNGAADYDPDMPMRYIYRGHVQGSGWQKEVAASMIDSDGVLSVPPTVKLEVEFPRRHGSAESIIKVGSLQRFARGDAVDTLSFEQMQDLPVAQVQKIGLLDALIGNADRNFGNCLVDPATGELTPIDHGFSLLDSIDYRLDNPQPQSEMNTHFHVLPQLAEPTSPELARWVLSLNGDAIAGRLRRELNLPESSIREFRMRLSILQRALEQRKPLSEIVPMLMASQEHCLIETCAASAAETCRNMEKEWERLPPHEAERARTETYYNIFHKELAGHQ